MVIGSTTGPLEGLIIADFSRVLAGPYATMLLADMGATVIKVESPIGDETRSWMPPMWEGESTYFLSVNRNKRSIALDFSKASDLGVAKRIAARADVFIENFKTGNLRKFGLDYESFHRMNPRGIYASITGFGTDEGAGLPGYDLLVQAASGLMSLTGPEDGPAFRAGVAVVDVITGLHVGMGILAALHHRAETGMGQRVEANLMSSALSALVNQTSAALLSDAQPTRMGNDHPSIFPYGPFEARGGSIIIATGNDSQFRRLVEVLGSPALKIPNLFDTVTLRNKNRAALKEHIEEVLSGKSPTEWYELLTQAGVPCAPINSVEEGLQYGVSLGLEPIVRTCDDQREVSSVANPITFSETPNSYRNSPPRLNQDEDWVLRWLGGSGDE